MNTDDDRVRPRQRIVRFTVTGLLLAAIGPLLAPAAAQAPSPPPIEWSRYQLRNGLDVVLAPDDSATEVSIEFVLELAVAANCEAIITHNVRDFVGAKTFKPQVLTPSAFLARMWRAI